MPVDGNLHTYRCEGPISQTVHIAVGSPIPLSGHITTNVSHPDAVTTAAERGRTVGTLFPL